MFLTISLCLELVIAFQIDLHKQKLNSPIVTSYRLESEEKEAEASALEGAGVGRGSPEWVLKLLVQVYVQKLMNLDDLRGGQEQQDERCLENSLLYTF